MIAPFFLIDNDKTLKVRRFIGIELNKSTVSGNQKVGVKIIYHFISPPCLGYRLWPFDTSWHTSKSRKGLATCNCWLFDFDTLDTEHNTEHWHSFEKQGTCQVKLQSETFEVLFVHECSYIQVCWGLFFHQVEVCNKSHRLHLSSLRLLHIFYIRQTRYRLHHRWSNGVFQLIPQPVYFDGHQRDLCFSRTQEVIMCSCQTVKCQLEVLKIEEQWQS